MDDYRNKLLRKCKQHCWKDGWICEKCGLTRSDYEEQKTVGKPVVIEISKSYVNYLKENSNKTWEELQEDYQKLLTKIKGGSK